MNNNSEELRSVLEYLAKKLVETLSPNFSTTNNDTTITFKISIVDYLINILIIKSVGTVYIVYLLSFWKELKNIMKSQKIKKI